MNEYMCVDAQQVFNVFVLGQRHTRDIRSNIILCLKEFPMAKPEETPEGKGLYLIVYPELSPNTDIISF